MYIYQIKDKYKIKYIYIENKKGLYLPMFKKNEIHN